jgi:hypothetical protein
MTFLTTRFTNETLAENLRYRDTHQHACIYGLGIAISEKHQEPFYVLEMNNTTNELVGIGQITKTTIPRTHIYSNPYYNRYIYKGTRYIPASQIPPPLKQELEQRLFQGKSHLKRGKSMTQFPPKWLKQEYYDFMLGVPSPSAGGSALIGGPIEGFAPQGRGCSTLSRGDA